MNTVTLCRFWCLFLLACASLWSSAQPVSAQPLQTVTVVDTPTLHFMDYLMRANAGLITPHARREIEAGRVRPSFSSMMHPVRYQLIDAADRNRIVDPMDLLCLNRTNRSLILACRSHTTAHERFVHISARACRENRPLSAILPADCAHPYVITRTGRSVTVPSVPVDTQTQPLTTTPIARRLSSAPHVPAVGQTPPHHPVEGRSPLQASDHRSAPHQPAKTKQTNVNTWMLFLALLLMIAYTIWKMVNAHKRDIALQELNERLRKALEDRDTAREELAQGTAEHQRLLVEKATQERVLKEREREVQQLRETNLARQGDVQSAQDVIETYVAEQENLKDRNKELERQLYQVVEYTRNKGVRLPSELTALVPTQPPPANFRVSPPRGTPREIRETYPHEMRTPQLEGAIGASVTNPRRDTPPGTVAITPHESTQPQMFLPEAQPRRASDDDSFLQLLREEEFPMIDEHSTLSGLGDRSGDETRFFNAQHLQGSFVVVPAEDQTVSHTPTKKLLEDASRSSPPPRFAGPVEEVRSMKFPTLVVDERKMAERARDSLTVPSTFPPKNSTPSDEADTLVLKDDIGSLAIKPPPADLIEAIAPAARPVEDNSEHSGPRLLTPLPTGARQRH